MDELFRRVLLGGPQINIGKNGLTPAQIENIKSILKRNKIIKIKVLKETAHEVGIEGFMETLVKGLGVYILDARGFTFIISKRKIPGVHLPKFHFTTEEPLADFALKESIQDDVREESLEIDDDNINDEDYMNDEDEIESDEIAEEEDKISENASVSESNLKKIKVRSKGNKRTRKREANEYIDYDNEELLETIDTEADELEQSIAKMKITKNKKLESIRQQNEMEQKKTSSGKTDKKSIRSQNSIDKEKEKPEVKGSIKKKKSSKKKE